MSAARFANEISRAREEFRRSLPQCLRDLASSQRGVAIYATIGNGWPYGRTIKYSFDEDPTGQILLQTSYFSHEGAGYHDAGDVHRNTPLPETKEISYEQFASELGVSELGDVARKILELEEKRKQEQQK